MMTRSYCCFCKQQMNDNEPARQHTSGAIAHERCLRPGDIKCEAPKPCEHDPTGYCHYCDLGYLEQDEIYQEVGDFVFCSVECREKYESTK